MKRKSSTREIPCRAFRPKSGRPDDLRFAPEIRPPAFDAFRLSRDGRIRTGDPLNPIQVRYRAAPRPETEQANGLLVWPQEPGA